MLRAALLAACAHRAQAGYLLPSDGRDIALNSTVGAALLANASHAAPYSQLMNHFVTQARLHCALLRARDVPAGTRR